MSHAAFITAAYAVTFLVTAGLAVMIVLDHRALKRRLAELAPPKPE
jgi:heme exporter protein CcmD